MGKAEDNKIRNERAILDAALELFSSKGLEQTSVSDVVAKSGLARGTFYNYFTGKEALWEKTIDLFVGSIAEILSRERKKARSLHEFMYNSFYAYARVFDDPRHMSLLTRNQAVFRKSIFSTDSINSIFTNLEKDLKESPYFEGLSQSQYKMTSYAMVGAAMELIIQSKTHDRALSVDDLSDYFSRLFIGGLEHIISMNEK